MSDLQPAVNMEAENSAAASATVDTPPTQAAETSQGSQGVNTVPNAQELEKPQKEWEIGDPLHELPHFKELPPAAKKALRAMIAQQAKTEQPQEKTNQGSLNSQQEAPKNAFTDEEISPLMEGFQFRPVADNEFDADGNLVKQPFETMADLVKHTVQESVRASLHALNMTKELTTKQQEETTARYDSQLKEIAEDLGENYSDFAEYVSAIIASDKEKGTRLYQGLENAYDTYLNLVLPVRQMQAQQKPQEPPKPSQKTQTMNKVAGATTPPAGRSDVIPYDELRRMSITDL